MAAQRSTLPQKLEQVDHRVNILSRLYIIDLNAGQRVKEFRLAHHHAGTIKDNPLRSENLPH